MPKRGSETLHPAVPGVAARLRPRRAELLPRVGLARRGRRGVRGGAGRPRAGHLRPHELGAPRGQAALLLAGSNMKAFEGNFGAN